MRIYLAGPDVFRPDAIEHGERLKSLCVQYGHEGLYPMDNKLPSHLKGREAAEWIYGADLAQLDKADVIIANVIPFRGPSCDVGTAVEIGYAVAQGKPVYLYSRDLTTYNDKVDYLHGADETGYFVDNMIVEGFGLVDNLMVVCTASGVHLEVEGCLAQLNHEIKSFGAEVFEFMCRKKTEPVEVESAANDNVSEDLE